MVMQSMKVLINNPIYIQNDTLMLRICMHNIIIKITYHRLRRLGHHVLLVHRIEGSLVVVGGLLDNQNVS